MYNTSDERQDKQHRGSTPNPSPNQYTKEDIIAASCLWSMVRKMMHENQS